MSPYGLSINVPEQKAALAELEELEREYTAVESEAEKEYPIAERKACNLSMTNSQVLG